MKPHASWQFVLNPLNVYISLTSCWTSRTAWDIRFVMIISLARSCKLTHMLSLVHAQTHTKIARRWLLPGWALGVRTRYKSPLPFLLVSQTVAVSDTRVKLTSICVARVGHSSCPRHATGQRQRAARTQRVPDTCFCVSYHFSIICISFISRRRAVS